MGHLRILCHDTRTIIKLFKNIDVKRAFKTTNTIKNHLKPREKTVDTCNQSGVYHLKYNRCPLKYIGEMGCTFRVRYKEHIQAMRTNIQNSKYSQHIT
jgi:hypothetical protein